MLSDLLRISTLATRLLVVSVFLTVGPSNPRRRSSRLHAPRWRAAQLAAQVAATDPELDRQLRQVTGRIIRLARMLQGELHRLPPLEKRLDHVARQLQGSPADEAEDDELFERLAERFRLAEIRAALQRLEQAHPDTLDDQH